MAEDDPFERDHAPPIGVAERLAPGLQGRHRAEPRADDLHRHPQLRRRRGRGGGDRPRPRRSRPPRGARRRRSRASGWRRCSSPTPTATTARAPAPSRRGSGRRCWRAGRSPLAPAPAFAAGGGEGRDAGFRPDEAIGEGSVVAGPGWTLTALATPGHTADHLAFAWAEGAALFSGDHVMGWATTLISPPDGALGAFRASLRRLQGRPETVYYPGHGAPVARSAAHRRPHPRAPRAARGRDRRGARARAGDGRRSSWRRSTPASTARLHAAAARNVLAHLVDLEARGLVVADGERFALAAAS